MSADSADGGDDLNVDAFQSVLEEHGFLSWMGLELVEAREGFVAMELPYDRKFANAIRGSDGNVHGGIVATLVDTSSGFALRTTFDDPVDAALTTTDLNVSYVRPAHGDLRVETEVVRAGGSMGVTEASVLAADESGERVEAAVGNTSYRLFRGESS
jgi:uncharacterized protein (TIGR00369 family)